MKLLSPFQAFIFASIGIHGSLFVMSDSINLTLPGSAGSVMSVKLEEKTQPAIQSNVRTLQNNEITKSTQKTTAQKQPEKTTVKHGNNNSQQNSLAKKINSESKAHVFSVIYKHLNEHFKYPKIAQRRNWEGQVVLAFHITHEGNIEDIKINHSSGYNVLDQAAMISLQKIGQLPQLTSWLNTGIEIQIPIIYQLTKG